MKKIQDIVFEPEQVIETSRHNKSSVSVWKQAKEACYRHIMLSKSGDSNIEQDKNRFKQLTKRPPTQYHTGDYVYFKDARNSFRLNGKIIGIKQKKMNILFGRRDMTFL